MQNTKDYFTRKFDEELARLNDRQKEAVSNIEGPMLVIAGPGTGKTQILALRVGLILKETDAQPHEILCLTFTEAGTVAMRKRLNQFIGPMAYKIPIHTFHSFANMVIQENLETFGFMDLQPISEIEQIELLHGLIDEFPGGHPLKRYGDPYFDTERLRRLFQLMKKENWNAEYVRKKVEEYLKDIETRDEFIYQRPNKNRGIQKGDLKLDKIKDEQRKKGQLLAAAEEFDRHDEMMKQHKRYDYEDMILWVLDKFKNDVNFLRKYQEQFQYFLVDEYQDTNGSQNELLYRLIDYWEEPNAFVVGDDDQSIYRFQGASVTNILDFSEKYQNSLKVVVLENNYRSTQRILDVSRHLIEKNTDRLVDQIRGISKDLKASNTDVAELPIEPEIRKYDNPKQEVISIAKEIVGLKEKGVNLSEVAVFYRNHKQAEEMAAYFFKTGIPINIKRKVNILNSPFTKKLLTWIRYVLGESETAHANEQLLFEILHYDFYDISPQAVAKLAMDIRRLKTEEYAKEEHERRRINWREYIWEHAQEGEYPGIPKKDWDGIRKMSYLIEGGTLPGDESVYKSLIKSVLNNTPQQFFEHLINEAGILGYVMRSDDQVVLMQELTTLFQWIKNETHKNPKASMSDLLKTIDVMIGYDLALPVIQSLYHEEGVQFMTAHGSKGLEFEHVYMIGCDYNNWKSRRTTGNYSFPDNMTSDISSIGDPDEENRRLFYVAMTRAKKNLVISFPDRNPEGKELEPAMFITDLTSHVPIQTRLDDASLEDMALFDFHLLSNTDTNILQGANREAMRKAVDNFHMNVTNLNTYLRCPRSFYFNVILRVPSAKTEYMAFGTAVHEALEKYFIEVLKRGKKPVELEVLLNRFEYSMLRERDSFTTEQFQRRLEYGKTFLPAYYDHYKEAWNLDVNAEKYITTSINGIPITGKIDKLEFTNQEVNIVDYKTGQLSRAKSKKYFNRPGEKITKQTKAYVETYGGDYWRQAVFYKILVDADTRNNWRVISSEFDFVEPDTKTGDFGKAKINITASDVEQVLGQLEEVYRKVQNLEFDHGCNEDDCSWCNFVKENYVHTSEATVEDEVEGIIVDGGLDFGDPIYS